jgi:hypothetical protein
MSRMRAKVRVTNIESFQGCENLTFQPVGANSYPADGKNEDNDFARWTPSGEIKLSVTNPDLHGKFEVGKTFYVDFTPAE